MKRSKKKFKLLIFIIIAFIIYSALFGGVKKTVDVKIEKGLSTTQIAKVLKDNDVISSRVVFLLVVNTSQYKGKLRYGDFTFEKGEGYFDVIKKVATGGAKKDTITITIPEGYSVEKIIKLLEESGFGTKREIESALNDSYDYEFIHHIKATSDCNYKLQGFLFPATYEFYTDDTPHTVFNKMLKEFEKQYDSLGMSYDDIYTIITKASLVEREAKLDSERSKIAGVIENRLTKDMRLQIDATIAYFISNGLYDVERVLYSDLERNSAYNTYKNTGLPVGPICNPGIKSIKAAINPDKHSYLYYRTDENIKDGSHIFTETFEAHTNANG